MPVGVRGQCWGKAAGPGCSSTPAGPTARGLSCGGLGELCASGPGPGVPVPRPSPSATWEGAVALTSREDHEPQEVYKVLGRNRRLGHPNESPAPITQVGKGPRTYAHFLVDEVSGQLDLLRKAPDGEHPQAGVRAGRRVPLKLHVRSRMLVYAFDVLAPCGQDTEE